MDPIRGLRFRCDDFIAEPRKIGGKNGRRDDDLAISDAVKGVMQ